MVPEIGDLIHILKDTHGYPINWVPGMNTVRFYHADNQMKHGDLVHWKKWEPGYTEPISAIGLLLEDPIESILFGSKVYKAKVLISQNSAIITLFNISLDLLQ